MATKKSAPRKKTPAKKAAAKKVSVKKAPPKKVAAKKVSAKKAPAKKAAKKAVSQLKLTATKSFAMDGDAIARALAKELPGWTRVIMRPASAAIVADSAARSIPGATMKVLRTKYLGSTNVVSDSSPNKPYSKPDKRRVTVQVQSESGSIKVADVVRGKTKIVQG